MGKGFSPVKFFAGGNFNPIFPINPGAWRDGATLRLTFLAKNRNQPIPTPHTILNIDNK